MDFIAHTENNKGDCHKLADHLRAVGQLAEKFVAQMNPELVECKLSASPERVWSMRRELSIFILATKGVCYGTEDLRVLF
jgi:hypothetical protein